VIRDVLERVRPAGVEPGATSAAMRKKTLRLVIPRVADPEDHVELLVERSGEVGLYCSSLGDDFYIKFNELTEPWESAGDLDEAARIVGAVLEGRVEARVTGARGRVLRCEYVLTDAEGSRRSMGRYYHLGNLGWALFARTRVLRTRFHADRP
jgi:hypothetical protein